MINLKYVTISSCGRKRLESSLSSDRHSPSVATLKKYAEALDCRLEIKLVANNQNPVA